jgi:hypothetical protein
MIRNGNMVEFRCRIRHTFSFEGLLDTHRTTQENALWAAVVALEEAAELARMVAGKSDPATRARLEHDADTKLQNSRIIAKMITEGNRTAK